MHRKLAVLAVAALTAALLAGCIGGDDLAAGPRPVVSVEEVSPDTYRFDASRSAGRGLTFEWSFGDGATATEPVAEHTYTYGDGTYTVRLLLTDQNGEQGMWTEDIIVGTGENLPPTAFFSLRDRVFAPGESVRVDASRSTDPENDPLEYRWDFNYLMSFADYEQFRAAKAGAVPGGGAGGGKLADGLPRLGDLLGPKHPGHGGDGGSDCVPSLMMHTITTSEPVYVLEDGFPDETCFFIRLQVYDVKGAHEPIVSEEIWPVLITNTPPPRFYSDSETGHFELGMPKDVADSLPDGADELITWEFETTFTTDSPAELAYVNVTFNENPLGENDPALGNAIYLAATAPNGVMWDTPPADQTGGMISFKWEYPFEDPGFGTWKVYIAARAGFDIDWEISWWVQMDANPFLYYEQV